MVRFIPPVERTEIDRAQINPTMTTLYGAWCIATIEMHVQVKGRKQKGAGRFYFLTSITATHPTGERIALTVCDEETAALKTARLICDQAQARLTQ